MYSVALMACMAVLANTREVSWQRRSVNLVQHHLRRALIAISLANVAFISAWQRRLYQPAFFAPSWSWMDGITLCLSILLLGALFYILLALAAKIRLRGRSWEGFVYCIPLFTVANVARRLAFPTHHGRVAAGLLILLPVAAGLAIVCFPRKLLPAVEFIVLGLGLLIPINLFRLAAIAVRHHEPPALASRFGPSPHSGPRVVWMVFDEMDFALSFPRRPVGLRLPEFDRLREESFFATSAHQPDADTEEALPSLISGKKVYGIPVARGDHILNVQFSPDGLLQDWSAAPNVFADLRAAHVNIGVIGWYLPYCRIFAALITDCYWEPIYSEEMDTPSMGRSFVDIADALTPVESRVRLIHRLQHMIVKAESMVSDPQLGLVFIHLPVPHGPEIFDRYNDRVTPFAVHKDWFFDTLLISDRTLGSIRRSMERAGLWEQSAVIVTSDHSLRESMMAHPNPVPLVPFIVKMPGQRQGTVFTAPFTTTVVRSLIPAIQRGEVTAANLPDWMRQHTR